MIKFNDASFGYSENSTIHDLSFKIDKGEFVAIIGSNGAGKSTVSKLIRGLLKPQSGNVIIDGVDTALVKPSTLASKIGFLFQNPDRQICRNTIRRELEFTLENTVTDENERARLLEQTMTDFGFDGNADPFTLSRGQRQKIAMASVIVNEPQILILDEPTTGLDYGECMHIMERVKALNERGVTVIMVSHDMELVLDFVSRVLVMNEGRLVADGDPKEIFYNDDIMNSASIIPPQIVALSSTLGERFGKVHTPLEMASAILSAKGTEVPQ